MEKHISTADSQDLDPRVIFAAERTYLAWIRTSISLMGFGFVVARFGLFMREFAKVEGDRLVATPSFSLWIGTALVVTGVVITIVSTLLHGSRLRSLRRQSSNFAQADLFIWFVAVALGLLGIVMILYLLSLRR